MILIFGVSLQLLGGSQFANSSSVIPLCLGLYWLMNGLSLALGAHGAVHLPLAMTWSNKLIALLGFPLSRSTHS